MGGICGKKTVAKARTLTITEAEGAELIKRSEHELFVQVMRFDLNLGEVPE